MQWYKNDVGRVVSCHDAFVFLPAFPNENMWHGITCNASNHFRKRHPGNRIILFRIGDYSTTRMVPQRNRNDCFYSGIICHFTYCLKTKKSDLMRNICIFIVACLIAAIIPIYNSNISELPEFYATTDWPMEYLGLKHQKTELTSKEKQFYKHFPGRIIKFSTSEAEYVIKWVVKPTRKLHPAIDCYKGSGYVISPKPVIRDAKGIYWSSFIATTNNLSFRVKERIYNDSGESWPDVSCWFWSAFFNKNSGPWWVVTISEFNNIPTAIAAIPENL